MTNLNNDTRELNIDELDTVSGGSLTGWMHTIIDTANAIARATPPEAMAGIEPCNNPAKYGPISN